MRRFPLRLDVKVAGGPGLVAADIFAPDGAHLVRPAVLFCFPGGGVTRAYFNIPGVNTFSFTKAMTAHGFVCVTFDHPGCGESPAPADGWVLTAEEIAAAQTQAMRAASDALRMGSADPELAAVPTFTAIGVGHSMGAMIVTLQQATESLYDAAALLCFTTRGLPEVLNEGERDAVTAGAGLDKCASLARARFGVPFPLVPQARGESAATRALAQVQGPLAAVSAMRSMLPGNVAGQAAELTCDLFIAAGDRDLTGPPHDIPAAFKSCRDLRLVVVPDCGHHLFVSAGAERLYKLFAGWAAAVSGATL